MYLNKANVFNKQAALKKYSRVITKMEHPKISLFTCKMKDNQPL